MKITDRISRVDVVEKISGKARYIEDMKFENLHYGRTLRSEIAKGRIKCIKYPDIPENLWVIDADDTFINQVKMIETDMPIFADGYVNYRGEPIALIVGRDKNEIIRFMKNIEVEYEEEEPVFEFGGNENIFSEQEYTKGDIENLDYDEVFERSYSTGYQEQLYMEKHGLVGDYSDGKLIIHGSMQCPYYIKNALIHSTGLADHDIRVIQTETGGAFGGKEEYPSLLACQVAAASMKIGAPVRLIFDRREDIVYTTKRHPSKTIVKTYLKDNRIAGMEFDFGIDAGPYLGLSDVVLQRGILSLTGCYLIENLRVKGRTYRTNNVFTGAFRGFGAPQTLFALEMHMNQLASHLGYDPLEFRRPYFVKRGDLSSTSGIYNEEIKLDEMADRLVEMAGYYKLKEEMGNYRGIGMSFIPHGGGFTGDGEAEHIKSVVKLVKDVNGYVRILVSSVEMGQGAKTVLSKIVASVLEIDMDKVIYDNPDTLYVPDSGPTVASRTTMVVGGLLYKAALRLKDKMDSSDEIEVIEHYRQPDYVKWDQENLRGNAYMSYSWSAVLAVVEIDPLTLEITCKDIYAVYDVGMPIDERTFLGQVHGGIAQGLGYAILEVMTSKDGLIEHNNFSSYTVPTIVDMPRMHTDWILNPYEEGPFGAKAAGELTLVGVAPAIAAAIENALDVEIRELPVTSEKLLKELLI
ncbi:CO or xanthine dehydrogenase, Mo-binding subunit [Dethiosulfatibacter aminovorans DSM 17477]|uniref:CO or xanthine dehydrogenase, Mo-binding subunit n=1 Tax=Dethiosulfatibacter aminovorans DSM 17477 TaxID=1121476 RepID=A0A1M6HBS9_9FIRM|nr:xanthine dehydrogenase family protein molybdopterin-binding subunit [Dethiosulfatibacter aminovorans]SHJ19631.1 CO or xanthine dehydrogenase, Mo-binding subunit [Dethiosulfatibacter aminovorans DSM 17477]